MWVYLENESLNERYVCFNLFYRIWFCCVVEFCNICGKSFCKVFFDGILLKERDDSCYLLDKELE